MADCLEIVARLASDDAEVLREAAFDAGEERCVAAVARLADLVASHNVGVQEAAERALRMIGGPETVQAMVPLLSSDEAPVRNIGMDVLRQVGATNLPALIGLLHDNDPDLRIFAADILGSASDVRCVVPLGEALLKDPEVNVRYQAAVSLGTLALPEGASWLNKAMHDDEWVQFAVIEALTKIRDDTSVGALAKALDKASDLVGSMIVDALGEMGNIKAVGQLLRRLDASPPPLQSKIVVALVKILGGKSLTLLSDADREKYRRYLLAALKDDDTDIQDAAIQGLGFVGGEDASREVLLFASKLDQDRDRDRILSCIDMLVIIGLSPALQEALVQGQGNLTLIAVAVAAKLADPALDQAMMEAFWNAERDVQREMSKALLETGLELPQSREFFREVLRSGQDGHVLKAAMTYLARAKDCESGANVFALVSHPFNDVKEAALEACVALWDEDMAQRFEAMVVDADPMQRLMGVYALGKAGDPAHLVQVKAAVDDPIPDIRKIALESLGKLCCSDPDILRILSHGLSDEHPEVRRAVVASLSQLTGEETTELLSEALEDADDWVRIRAMEALAARGDEQSVERIMPLLKADSPMLTFKAMEVLSEMGGCDAQHAIQDMLDHEDPQIQAAAAEALARMQDRCEVR